MNYSGGRKTKLELLLFVWTALNVAIGVWVVLTGQLTSYGSGAEVWIPLAIALPASLVLLWRLREPTRTLLLFGTLFWALQIVSVRLPDALYKFRLGLSVDFRLTDDPSLVVAVKPEGVEVQVVSLGAFPPEAIHDALYRTLHLVPSSNSIYIEQTGGIGGFHQLFGPVSLSGHCASAP